VRNIVFSILLPDNYCRIMVIEFHDLPNIFAYFGLREISTGFDGC
jgi:hypothetical protein